jgi:hypothetical protein
MVRESSDSWTRYPPARQAGQDSQGIVQENWRFRRLAPN